MHIVRMRYFPLNDGHETSRKKPLSLLCNGGRDRAVGVPPTDCIQVLPLGECDLSKEPSVLCSDSREGVKMHQGDVMSPLTPAGSHHAARVLDPIPYRICQTLTTTKSGSACRTHGHT